MIRRICFCWVAYIYCLRDNLHEILENFILERVDDEKGLRYLIKVHLLLSKIGKRIEEFISLGLFESAQLHLIPVICSQESIIQLWCNVFNPRGYKYIT